MRFVGKTKINEKPKLTGTPNVDFILQNLHDAKWDQASILSKEDVAKMFDLLEVDLSIITMLENKRF